MLDGSDYRVLCPVVDTKHRSDPGESDAASRLRGVGPTASGSGRNSVSDIGGDANLDNFRAIRSLESSSDRTESDVEMTKHDMTNGTQQDSNPIDLLKQITIGQWIIATIVLVAMPVVAYVGTFYLYPYLTDQFESESPVETILKEYGAAEDAETQLLTIRRGDLVNSVAVNGTLEYANRERLSFGLAGTVEYVNVEVGDVVRRGDALMTLSDDAVISAEQELQNATVALQEAEQALDELVNPDKKTIDDATLKVFETEQKLADAETHLLDLLDPSELDLANAELAATKAIKTVTDAEAELEDLVKPPKIEIEEAQLAVADAVLAVEDAKEKLENLTRLNRTDLVEAEHDLNEAVKERDDAKQALDELREPDAATINQAELDIKKASLAVFDAQHAVTDAATALKDAEEAIEDELSIDILIAEAESELASTELAYDDAVEAQKEAEQPYEEEEVNEIHEQMAEAESDIKVAEDQRTQLMIEIASESVDLENALNEAREVYQDVFFKWLGMDISRYEWQTSPDEIFEDIGKTLPEIMHPASGLNRLIDRDDVSSEWLSDNPDTPWNEAVVATWTEFFLSNLRFDCTELGTGITDECVNIEFDDAWDALSTHTEAYEKFTLSNSQKIDNVEDAIDAARKELEDLNERLTELLEPTDDGVLIDLKVKVDLADLRRQEAESKLERLLTSEIDETMATRVAEFERAKHDLVVAKKELEVAKDVFGQASSDLSDLLAGGSEVDVALAKSRIEKAEVAVNDVIETLNEIQSRDTDAIRVAEHEILVAQEELNDKTAALDGLLEPDPQEIAVLEQEIEVARSDLQAKIDSLDELNEQDELEIELAEQQIEVAKADVQVAQDDLDDLNNPDDATVALRRAEVATALDDLESAQSVIDEGRIVAPFDGVVSAVSATEGDQIAAGAEVVGLADPSVVEVSGTVDEVDVLFLQVGDEATISLEALGDEQLVGRISDIAAFGESNQGVVTYPVTIQTDQPAGTQLPEGLSAVAEIVIREQTDKLLVPIQALFGSVNEPILLVSNPDGTIEPREVTLGISDDFWTVIEEGIGEGETILMTVVGADTSQFSGFRAISSTVRFSSARAPGGGR